MTRRTTFDHTPDGLRRRLGNLERGGADRNRERPSVPSDPPPPPLPYSWSGPVADLVDMASSPGLFGQSGTLYRIDYRFTVAASVTVLWELDGVTIATHTRATSGHETLSEPYDGGDLVATVTADAGAEGLSAFVFLR